jgi:hypothetical protein
MRGAINPLPLYVFMAWCLVKHCAITALCREEFALLFVISQRKKGTVYMGQSGNTSRSILYTSHFIVHNRQCNTDAELSKQRHYKQNISGAHPASSLIGTSGSFLWGKAAGA